MPGDEFGIPIPGASQGQGLDPLSPLVPQAPAQRTRAPAPPRRPPVRPPPPPVVTPPEPTGPTSVPDAVDIAGWLIALGLIALLAALLEFFKWFFRFAAGNPRRKIPTDDLTNQEFGQALSSALGRAVQTKDNQIGVALTQMSQDVTRVGRVFVALATAIRTVDQRLMRLSGQQADTQALAAAAGASARTANDAATRGAARTRAEAQRAHAREHGITQTVTGLSEHITRVIQPELDALRDRIPQLEKGLATTEHIVGKHEDALGIAGVTAATAVALSRLGAQWARCETPQLLGSALCESDPNKWRRLLHDLLPLIGIVELCGLVKLIAEAGRNPVIVDGLGLFSHGVEELLTCTGATRPTPLTIPAASLGQPIAWATLAPVNG